jgi:hypothetical protein
MRPARIIVAVTFAAAAAVTGSYIGLHSTTSPRATAPVAPVAGGPSIAPETPTTAGGATNSEPVVLADGRHPVLLKTIDPGQRTVTFDLVQFYRDEEAAREAAKDHQ